jgi:hypothetical protein
MAPFLVIFLIFPAASGVENLVINPSFETVDADKPAHWNLFLLPQPGAAARLDTRYARDGRCAVMIHNPDTYPADPANNWSQNLSVDLAGKTFVVGGYIKTENATGAALWLQC